MATDPNLERRLAALDARVYELEQGRTQERLDSVELVGMQLETRVGELENMSHVHAEVWTDQ